MNTDKKAFYHKFYTYTARLLLCILLLASFAALGVPAVSGGNLLRAPYTFCVENTSAGSGFSGTSAIYVYEGYVLPENEHLTLEGWFVTDEGVHHYEYAWVSGLHRAPEWQTVHDATIFDRPDLAAAGIPYPGGHSTAGFSIDIPPLPHMTDGYYDLYVRAVTGDGVNCDMVLFSRLRYGTPDADDGMKRIVSFTRLAKTEGALTKATVTEAGLMMTNQSIAALGSLELGVFERIKITYSLDEAYTDGKQALIGFKSSPEHLYGDGNGWYNLTDHVTALPLNTSATEPQTVELDLSKVQLKDHQNLYLSAYLKDGVTLTVHQLELTYRGEGYDHTAAKIYLSADVIGKFSGTNMVTIGGVNDPVMGDVLRIEVLDETNDPFAHFNAWSLMNDYDVNLSADDYKYMVVLARASKENKHSSMTFYLCAGSIIGATEACTYTHTLTTDGQWHYYVFDLTSKENWTGGINGWRFDIINGDCQPGNYVDFASIQLFRTPEAAAAAASAPVTGNITPHALGMSAVIRDDIEESHISDDPMIFPEGEWFEETTLADTEPPLGSETHPDTPTVTRPSEETSPTPDVPDSEVPTDQQGSTKGCGALASLSPLFLLVLFSIVIKKKIFGGYTK